MVRVDRARVVLDDSLVYLALGSRAALDHVRRSRPPVHQRLDRDRKVRALKLSCPDA